MGTDRTRPVERCEQSDRPVATADTGTRAGPNGAIADLEGSPTGYRLLTPAGSALDPRGVGPLHRETRGSGWDGLRAD
jgi:hypothetical protein